MVYKKIDGEWVKQNAYKRENGEWVQISAKTPVYDGTDLTGTTWYVPSGWTTNAGYGQFDVAGAVTGNGYVNSSFVFFHLGYYANYDYRNGITFGGVFTSRNTANDFTITFTGGTDVTNADLIAWLETYGELQ